MTVLSNDRKSQNGPPHDERSSFFPSIQTVSFWDFLSSERTVVHPYPPCLEFKRESGCGRNTQFYPPLVRLRKGFVQPPSAKKVPLLAGFSQATLPKVIFNA